MILLFFIVSILTLYIYLTWNFNHWKKKGVKFLKPVPIFGNMLKMCTFKISAGQFMKNVYDGGKGEDFVGMYVFTKPALVLRKLDLVKMILVKDFQNFSDRSVFFDMVHDPLGSNNLFSIKNPMWKSLRIKLTPFFTSSKIKIMFELINKVAIDMKDYVDKEISNDSVLEVKDLCSKFSTDAIASVAFGLEANSFKNPEALFRKLHKKLFNFNLKRSIETNSIFFAPYVAKLLG